MTEDYDDTGTFMAFCDIIRMHGPMTAMEYDELQVINKPSRREVCRFTGKGWRETLQMAAETNAMADGKVDADLVSENVRLAKRKQKLEDVNRVERKAFRGQARIENAVEELNAELVRLLKETQYPALAYPNQNRVQSPQAVGIVHLTDAHFNELVELPFNRYDFEEAAKRCKKLIQRAKDYFSIYKIRTVLFAMTGDMINSDRRLDEMLTNCTNRSKALLLSTFILEQMIIDLSLDYDVVVTAVTGNESRVRDEPGWGDIVATDNYDFTIFNMLSYKLDSHNCIAFDHPSNYNEHRVNVCGANVLLLHGQQVKTNYERSIQQIMGKYSARGESIDFVLTGHLHSARIGDSYARGGSVVGSNAYSDSGLQLIGRASQNIHIVYPRGSHDSIRVDLQDTSDVKKGYTIIPDLIEYNAKSARKLKSQRVILEVTV